MPDPTADQSSLLTLSESTCRRAAAASGQLRPAPA